MSAGSIDANARERVFGGERERQRKKEHITHRANAKTIELHYAKKTIQVFLFLFGRRCPVVQPVCVSCTVINLVLC